jgi:hypothetical protein
LTPVPIAVAPMLISRSSAASSPSRSMSSLDGDGEARELLPSVIGTASCSWVRPILITSANSRPSAKASPALLHRARQARRLELVASRIAVG